MIKEAWKAVPFRTSIGIAKDGRPILSPLRDGGKQYGPCDVDVCNGVNIDGRYMYASTTFHPYIMGCFGRGSAPKLYQECSENPRLCDVEYDGVKVGDGKLRKKSNAKSGLTMSWMLALVSTCLYIVQLHCF